MSRGPEAKLDCWPYEQILDYKTLLRVSLIRGSSRRPSAGDALEKKELQ